MEQGPGGAERTDGTRRVLRWVPLGAVAAGLTWALLAAGLDPAWPSGVAVGAVGAVVAQRTRLAWFASTIRQTEGSGWMRRLPEALGSLALPLSEVQRQLDRRRAAIEEVTARDRLREVTVDALELRLHALEMALDDSRADVAEIIAALDRALAGDRPAAAMRGDLEEVRRLIRLNAYAELPNDDVALGDVVADVVAGGVDAGRVSVGTALPAVAAPTFLVEAMVDGALQVALADGVGHVRVRGSAEGAMALLAFSAGDPTGPGPAGAVLRRALAILGGDVTRTNGEMVVVVPRSFTPGMRAVRPTPDGWAPEGI